MITAGEMNLKTPVVQACSVVTGRSKYRSLLMATHVAGPEWTRVTTTKMTTTSVASQCSSVAGSYFVEGIICRRPALNQSKEKASAEAFKTFAF